MGKALPAGLILCLLGMPLAAQDGGNGGPVNGAPSAGMPVSDQGQQPGQPPQQGQMDQPPQQGQMGQQGQMDQPQQPGGESTQAPQQDDGNTYNPDEMAPSAENPASPKPAPAAADQSAGAAAAPAASASAAAAPAPKGKHHGKGKSKAAQKPADDASSAKPAAVRPDISPVPLTPVTPSNP